MNEEALTEETRKRLMEIDPELGRDEAEIERQKPFVLDALIADAEMSWQHHERISTEGITDRYKEMYKRVAEQQRDKWEALRRFKDARVK